MNKTEETLTKLMNREITPGECMTLLDVSSDRELEELIMLSDTSRRTRKMISLQAIPSMNFLEVREYCKGKVNKGINLNDLAMELDIKWENGEISGFDHRYFKESVGLKITKEFISRAKSIGRYDK